MTTTSPTTQRRQPAAAALLVDFGGVLTVPLERAFGALSVESGLDPRTALRLLATHEGARTALGEHEVGRLDDEGFEDAFAAAIAEVGGRVEARGLLARLAHHLDLDEPMVDLVREVRAAGVPVALVSNSLGRDCYARVDLDELFDVTVISGQVGVRKPSRRIYAIAADRLGLAPEQCVMVDDLEHNLVGAARLGIRGIHHRTAADTVRAVREVLVLPRPTPA
ncbi:HAD family hydrolase [Janibacter hoylei]|uniref:HAD family phosphatase n=1 Tax=Janibacter hoylei PVAS-1 TaxID=1210046 RepID=K1EMC6_9MICO|nr:HAD family phosphatase [Janibacter hoylei]EKA60433.1 putative hydrolase [Janibacter hoylei PVAS-1]RWU82535.1 HAD family phosphatase [Janibacter hoylei PVAS-1]